MLALWAVQVQNEASSTDVLIDTRFTRRQEDRNVKFVYELTSSITNPFSSYDIVAGATLTDVLRCVNKTALRFLSYLLHHCVVQDRFLDMTDTVDVRRVVLASIHVTGMTCAGCANALSETLMKQSGVQSASVDLGMETATVWLDPSVFLPSAAIEVIEGMGFLATLRWSELHKVANNPVPVNVSGPTEIEFRMDSPTRRRRVEDQSVAIGGVPVGPVAGAKTEEVLIQLLPPHDNDANRLAIAEFLATFDGVVSVTDPSGLYLRQNLLQVRALSILYDPSVLSVRQILALVEANILNINICTISQRSEHLNWAVTLGEHQYRAVELYPFEVTGSMESPWTIQHREPAPIQTTRAHVLPITGQPSLLRTKSNLNIDTRILTTVNVVRRSDLATDLEHHHAQLRTKFVRAVFPCIAVVMMNHLMWLRNFDGPICPGFSVFDLLSVVLSSFIVIHCGDIFIYRGWQALKRCNATMDVTIAMNAMVCYIFSLTQLLLSIFFWGSPIPYLKKEPKDKMNEVAHSINASIGNPAAVLPHRYPNASFIRGQGNGQSYIYGLRRGMEAVGKTVTSHRYHGHNVIPSYFDVAALLITVVLLGRMCETKAQIRAQSRLNSLSSANEEDNVVLVRPPSPDEAAVELYHRTLGPPGSTALVWRLTQLHSDLLQIGDVVLLRKGSACPADCTLLSSATIDVNQSAITGESRPVLVKPSQVIIKGAILVGPDNALDEVIAIVRAVGRSCLISAVREEVGAARASKLSYQRHADRYAAVFIPFVSVLALITFMVWFVLLYTEKVKLDIIPQKIDTTEEIFMMINHSLGFGVSVLAMACPCALGLATPLALALASWVATKSGIVLRNPTILEDLPTVQAVVFDKTGTLTMPFPVLAGLMWSGLLRDDRSSIERLKRTSIWRVFSKQAETQQHGSDRLQFSYKDVCGRSQLTKLDALWSEERGSENLSPIEAFLTESLFWWLIRTTEAANGHPLAMAVVQQADIHLLGYNVGPEQFRVVARSVTAVGVVARIVLPHHDDSDHLEVWIKIGRAGFSNHGMVMDDEKLFDWGGERIELGYSMAFVSLSMRVWSKDGLERLEASEFIDIPSGDNFRPMAGLSFNEQLQDSVHDVMSWIRDERELDSFVVTGDNAGVANSIGDELGIDYVIHGSFPIDKRAVIAAIQAPTADSLDVLTSISPVPLESAQDAIQHWLEHRLSQCKMDGAPVLFVGDGENDILALQEARIGVAFAGGQRTLRRSLLNCGDVTIIGDNLGAIRNLFELGEQTIKIIRLNYIWATAFNAIGLPVAAGCLYPYVYPDPWVCTLLMSSSTIFVVGNSLRLGEKSLSSLFYKLRMTTRWIRTTQLSRFWPNR